MSKRIYTVLPMRAGCHFECFPPFVVTSRARIRVVAVVMFRKWFGGRCPDGVIWHKDGFMAEARDHRANCIQIEQINWRHTPKYPERKYRTRGPAQIPPYNNETALVLVGGCPQAISRWGKEAA